MKFVKTTKTALLPLLDTASKFAGPAISSKAESQSPAQTVIRLRFMERNTKLVIQAFNFSSGANFSLPVENIEQSSFLDEEVDKVTSYLLPTKLLLETVAKCGNEVSLGLDTRDLVVKTEIGQIAITSISDDDPTINAKLETYPTGLSGMEFSKALGMVAFAVKKWDDTRPTLTGVKFDLSDEHIMRLIGTDGFRVSSYTTVLDWKQVNKEEFEKNFIVPIKFINALSNCLAKNPSNIRLGVNGTRFTVEWDSGYADTTLIQGNFPDVDAVTPKSAKTKLSFIDNFQNAVRSAKVLACGSERPLPIIRLDITSERTLLQSSSDIGNSQITLQPEFEGEGSTSMMIAFDADLIPTQISGKLQFGLNTPTTPAVITSPEVAGWNYLLMPCHIGVAQ